MTVSPKALRWAHNLRATVAIKYFTQSQSTAKKRKYNVQLEASEDSIETRTARVSQDWLEAGTVNEVMEALHNWTAIRFLIAPWDWSGILMARVIHGY